MKGSMSVIENERSEIKDIKRIQAKFGIINTSLLFLLFLLSLVSVYIVLIIVFGILPALVAKIVDKSEDQILGRTVMSFNISGLCIYLTNVLSNLKNASTAAQKVMYDPYTWLVVYGMCGFGWLIHIYTPKIFNIIYMTKAKSRVNALNAELKEIADEWGDDIIRQEHM